MDTHTLYQSSVIVCFLLSAISQVWTDSDDELECRGPWIKLHRACYKFDKNRKSWDDAQADCELEGGNLISIGSLAEFDNVKAQMKKSVRTMNDLHWWVGLRKRGDDWVWADGGQLMKRLTPWKPGEPNNGKGNEECGEMNHKMQLVDQKCGKARNYVCERNKITPPPTQSTVFVSVSTLPTVPLSKRTDVNNVQNDTTSPQADTSNPSFNTVVTDMQSDPTSAATVPKQSPVIPAKSHPTSKDSTDLTGQNSVTAGTTVDSKTRVITSISSVETTVSGTDSPSKFISTLAASTPNELAVTNAEVPETPRFPSFKGCYVITDTSGNSRGNTQNSKRGSMEEKFCLPTVLLDINWPKTRAGQIARVTCGNGKGKATWKCGENPVCWRDDPNIDECASPAFQNLLEELKPDINDTKPPTSEEAVQATSLLVEVTSSESELTSADVGVSASVIESVANTKPKDEEAVKDIVKNVITAGSNIVSENKTSTWTKMTEKEKVFSASKLLVAMETATNAMAEALTEPTVIETKDENIAMALHVVDVEVMQTDELVYGGEEEENSFSIPIETLKSLSKGGLAKIVFMTHYKMGEFLAAQDEEDENCCESMDTRQTKPKATVASHVISASLNKNQLTRLPEPITFSMKLLKPMEQNARPLCSFWNFSSGAAGRWSQNGCQATRYNRTHTTCQCNHLTNFAILMDVEGVEIPTYHYDSLRYITYVGCIISLICLFVSWLTFQCFGSLQGERNSIHKNLAFCLFVAEIVFLTGIERTENKLACSIIAGVLHFFFLAAFTWMFLEGIHIVIMLIQVFDVAKSRLKRYYLAGYGIPAVVVGAAAGVYYQGYGTASYCWLTTERYFIWSFAGPVALILLINAIILTYAMSAVCKHSEYVFTKEKNQGGSMRAWIQGCFALEVLLGLTWVFGYFYISRDTLPMAYIFTVLNSLQGLFIFLFHCILNKKVRKEYKHVLRISDKTSKTHSGSGTKTASLRKQSQSYQGSDKCEVFTPTP